MNKSPIKENFDLHQGGIKIKKRLLNDTQNFCFLKNNDNYQVLNLKSIYKEENGTGIKKENSQKIKLKCRNLSPPKRLNLKLRLGFSSTLLIKNQSLNKMGTTTSIENKIVKRNGLQIKLRKNLESLSLSKINQINKTNKADKADHAKKVRPNCNLHFNLNKTMESQENDRNNFHSIQKANKNKNISKTGNENKNQKICLDFTEYCDSKISSEDYFNLKDNFQKVKKISDKYSYMIKRVKPLHNDLKSNQAVEHSKTIKKANLEDDHHLFENKEIKNSRESLKNLEFSDSINKKLYSIIKKKLFDNNKSQHNTSSKTNVLNNCINLNREFFMLEQIKAQEKKIYDLEHLVQKESLKKSHDTQYLKSMIEKINIENNLYINRCKTIKERLELKKRVNNSINMKNENAFVLDNVEELRKMIESEETNKLYIEKNCVYDDPNILNYPNNEYSIYFLKEQIQELKDEINNKVKNYFIFEKEGNEILDKNNILTNDFKVLVNCLANLKAKQTLEYNQLNLKKNN